MELTVIMSQKEYDNIQNTIKDLKETIKDLENKSMIVAFNSRGDIKYIKNSPEYIDKIYQRVLKISEEQQKNIHKIYRDLDYRDALIIDYQKRILELEDELKKFRMVYDNKEVKLPWWLK